MSLLPQSTVVNYEASVALPFMEKPAKLDGRVGPSGVFCDSLVGRETRAFPWSHEVSAAVLSLSLSQCVESLARARVVVGECPAARCVAPYMSEGTGLGVFVLSECVGSLGYNSGLTQLHGRRCRVRSVRVL